MRKWMIAAVLALGISLTTRVDTLAGGSTGTPLAERVETLEKLVANHTHEIGKLKQKVAALEAAQNELETAKKARAWKRLRPGMSQAEVRKVLGVPGKAVQRGERWVWYYPDREGGRAEFENKRLVEWKGP